MLVANHQSNIDPFLINVRLNRQIHYLVSDSNMRRPLTRTLFAFFGSIPKTKMLPDYAAIKRALAIVKKGGIVGIFPEGQATWNGATTTPLPETAKLLKFFGVTLFMAEIHGSYHAMPRWGRGVRRGPIDITYHTVYTPDEIARSDIAHIGARLQGLFAHNEYELQQKQRHRYLSERRAEYCESFLFICPVCHATQTLYSRGNAILCTTCGPLTTLNQEGLCAHSSPRVPFKTLHQWDQWQRNYWRERLHEVRDTFPLLVDTPVRVTTGFRSQKVHQLGEITMELFPQSIVTSRIPQSTARATDRETPAHFAIHEIAASNVQNGEKLEFYYRGALYSFDILHKNRNAYKWHLSISLMQEIAHSRVR